MEQILIALIGGLAGAIPGFGLGAAIIITKNIPGVMTVAAIFMAMGLKTGLEALDSRSAGNVEGSIRPLRYSLNSLIKSKIESVILACIIGFGFVKIQNVSLAQTWVVLGVSLLLITSVALDAKSVVKLVIYLIGATALFKLSQFNVYVMGSCLFVIPSYLRKEEALEAEEYSISLNPIQLVVGSIGSLLTPGISTSSITYAISARTRAGELTSMMTETFMEVVGLIGIANNIGLGKTLTGSSAEWCNPLTVIACLVIFYISLQGSKIVYAVVANTNATVYKTCALAGTIAAVVIMEGQIAIACIGIGCLVSMIRPRRELVGLTFLLPVIT
jgi:hypothetical protein